MRHPKGIPLRAKYVKITYRSSVSVHRLGSTRRIKQTLKGILNNQHVLVTCSPRPPTLSRNPFRSFGSPRGSKFALSHYFGCWLLHHLVLPYSLDNCTVAADTQNEYKLCIFITQTLSLELHIIL